MKKRERRLAFIAPLRLIYETCLITVIIKLGNDFSVPEVFCQWLKSKPLTALYPLCMKNSSNSYYCSALIDDSSQVSEKCLTWKNKLAECDRKIMFHSDQSGGSTRSEVISLK